MSKDLLRKFISICFYIFVTWRQSKSKTKKRVDLMLKNYIKYPYIAVDWTPVYMGDTAGNWRQMDIGVGTSLVGPLQTYSSYNESCNDLLRQFLQRITGWTRDKMFGIGIKSMDKGYKYGIGIKVWG